MKHMFLSASCQTLKTSVRGENTVMRHNCSCFLVLVSITHEHHKHVILHQFQDFRRNNDEILGNQNNSKK